MLNIADAHKPYTEKLKSRFEENGVRCESDLRNEKITYKIREHSMQRIPYLLILGDREMQEQSVTVRAQNGEDLGSMKLDSFVAKLKDDINNKI